MEIARRQHGVEPPQLVKLEYEVAHLLDGSQQVQATESEDLTPAIKALLRSLDMDEHLADHRDDIGR
jgi:hypothetical protein